MRRNASTTVGSNCVPAQRSSSARACSAGMPAEEARAELERCAGTQFDPTVVEAFLGTLAAPRARPRLGVQAA